MTDSTILGCEDVRKQVKPFLEDLLAEDEYQLFVRHLAGCPKCNEYVGRFGTLSNQLWKMGDVKVPSDFSSTVLFNLSQLEAEARTSKPGGAKNFIALAVTLIVIAAIVFVGIDLIMKNSGSRKTSGVPIVTAGIIIDRKASGNSEAEALLEELKSIAASLGVPGEKIGAERTVKKAPAAGQRPFSSSGNVSDQKKINVPEPWPLHWHFLYGENSEKIKLMEIISFQGIDVRKQASSLVVLSATDEKLEDLMEKIVSGFKGESTLSNFSAEQGASHGKESRVSIYLQDERSRPSQDLHWHLKQFQISKAKFIDIVRKGGGSVNYELENLLIVLCPKNYVENLSKKLAAMGIYLDAYGQLAAKEDLLDSGPITISVYFS